MNTFESYHDESLPATLIGVAAVALTIIAAMVALATLIILSLALFYVFKLPIILMTGIYLVCHYRRNDSDF